MADFRFHVPAECSIGQDAIFKIPLMLDQGLDKAFMVLDPDPKDAANAERLITVLEGRGVSVIRYDELDGRPTGVSVVEALDMVRGARAPLIIGAGGIRALHVAKALSALALDRVGVEDWMDGNAPSQMSVPLILIPTSYRDPFLLSGGLVLTDGRNGQAVFLQARRGIESAVVLDPGMMSAPSGKAASAAILDGMMAAVEGYVSSRENFLSDLALAESIRLYLRALDVIMQRPEEPQAKADAARACFMAALGLASSSPGLGTAVSYSINARWGVPKANLGAVIIPYLLESLARSKPEKIAALAASFCEIDPAENAAYRASKAVEAVRTRLGLLKIPSRLKDFDLVLERLVETAESARRFDFMNFLPRAMTVDDVFDFIKMVY